MDDITRELYECLMERIYGTKRPVDWMGATPRERDAMDAYINRGYESQKPIVERTEGGIGD